MVQLALLAEDEVVASRLASRGLSAQTVDSLQPLQVRDAGSLEQALTGLGADAGLGLSGRPAHRLGTLTTSQFFASGDTRWVCPPMFASQSGFYLGLDNRLLIEEIGIELASLHRHWHRDGQPLMVLVLTEAMLDASGADDLLDELRTLTTRRDVRVGRLADLLPQVCVCHLPQGLEWPAPSVAAATRVDTATGIGWDEAATRALTPERAAAIVNEPDTAALLRQFGRSRNPYEQIDLMAALWRRAGPSLDSGLGGTVREVTGAIYLHACHARRWGVVRRAAGLLDLLDDGLEEAVAQIVARGKRVALGRAYSADSVVARPMAQRELVELLRAHTGRRPPWPRHGRRTDSAAEHADQVGCRAVRRQPDFAAVAVAAAADRLAGA